jgi:PAS domain S-box-containing protein
VSVIWISGLRRWVSVIAAVSLVVTVGALIVAVTAAAGTRAASRELSQRLVPAAAASGVLLDRYTAQQNSLRDYVTSGRPTALQPFSEAATQIPGQQAGVASLVRGYPLMAGQLAAAATAQRAWLARVASPQLASAQRGDFTRARALQANIPFTRSYVLAVRSRVADLQAQIVAAQAEVTNRLIDAQGRLFGALVAMCLVVALMAVGGVLGVRRWLLTPFTRFRAAADSVAAGHYDTPVPAVGPAELADLGRSTELMRTRLVAALAEAERAEERFRGLFESSPDAILTVAADGSIVTANAQAERTFGYGVGEMSGLPVENLVLDAARSAHRAHRASYAGDPRPRPMGEGLDLTGVRRDGREVPVEISLSSLPTEDGVVVLAAVRDISERLAAEAERERLRAEAEQERFERRQQESQRLESLGQLVGGVAHDFNNLLNIIGGYTDFVAEQVAGLTEEDKRLQPVLADIKQVREATQRAARLTRQLLIFARRDVVHPEVLDVNGVVSGVEQLLRRTLGEHIDLVFAPASDLWMVKADAGQLEQVLVNLAVNSRDAMPGGGKLTIDTGNVVVDKVYADRRPDLATGRYVQVRVSDTGVGMSREVVARVFEPFYSTKPKGQGTGLGLATVYGIITHAGGHAHIYSEPGVGTTVTTLLPATDAAATVAGPAAAAPAHGRGELVLLVEDEPDLRELANRILVRGGYQVYSAAATTDALRYASDLQQPIDLLLTDVIMPEMLGNEVAARVRAIRPSLPVLFMSGYAERVLDSQGALDANVDLLEKPFSEATLLTRVRLAIDNGAAIDNRAAIDAGSSDGTQATQRSGS